MKLEECRRSCIHYMLACLVMFIEKGEQHLSDKYGERNFASRCQWRLRHGCLCASSVKTAVGSNKVKLPKSLSDAIISPEHIIKYRLERSSLLAVSNHKFAWLQLGPAYIYIKLEYCSKETRRKKSFSSSLSSAEKLNSIYQLQHFRELLEWVLQADLFGDGLMASGEARRTKSNWLLIDEIIVVIH